MSVRSAPLLDGTAARSRISRYDLYLALLPVPLLLGVGGALTVAAPVSHGAGVGSVLSALILGHGLFRDAPTAPDGGGVERRDGRAVRSDD
ncbi:MAG: hypothetical protein ABEH47_06560 [Haloferacaceae archaeon]